MRCTLDARGYLRMAAHLAMVAHPEILTHLMMDCLSWDRERSQDGGLSQDGLLSQDREPYRRTVSHLGMTAHLRMAPQSQDREPYLRLSSHLGMTAHLKMQSYLRMARRHPQDSDASPG